MRCVSSMEYCIKMIRSSFDRSLFIEKIAKPIIIEIVQFNAIVFFINEIFLIEFVHS